MKFSCDKCVFAEVTYGSGAYVQTGCKIDRINKINPKFISTGNIGCITQIANGTKIPILHTVEIIDWYTGGPKPAALAKL